MLNASKLKNFLVAAQGAIPAIKQTIRVVSDDDVANFTRDILTSDEEVVLIGILPSFGLNFKNEDNYNHSNKLMLFIVKKFDINEGNDAFLDIYDETSAIVLEFQKWLFEESREFPCPPLFKDIRFQTFDADPVRDYHGFFGYMVQFELNN